jgi:DNA-binding response OmpR family regulator
VTYTFRALVIEDEVLVRQATSRALTNEGFVCDVAADGGQAMEKLQHRTFDIAIVDLRIPVMNGHKLIVEMLAMNSPPVIMVFTGVPEPRLVRDLFARGVDDVIAKPANYDVLALKAKALAERRRLLKQKTGAQRETTSDLASKNLPLEPEPQQHSSPEDELELNNGEDAAIQLAAQAAATSIRSMESSSEDTPSVDDFTASIGHVIKVQHGPKRCRRRRRKLR